MEVLSGKTNSELIQVLLKESAKASSELRCAEADVKKAQSRLGFILMLINVLMDRDTDHTNQGD